MAYTLTYSALGQGTLSAWTASLDAQLANPAVTGDLRVNWLLARAKAQEFTRTAPAHYPFGAAYPSSSSLDGQDYLYQAVNAAQTPSIKVRAAGEIAARLTAAGDLQGATNFLGQVTGSLPDDQKAVVAAWQQTISGYVAGQAQAVQAQQSLANKGYLKTLQARRAQAASQGDSDAVSRYDSLISAASNGP